MPVLSSVERGRARHRRALPISRVAERTNAREQRLECRRASFEVLDAIRIHDRHGVERLEHIREDDLAVRADALRLGQAHEQMGSFSSAIAAFEKTVELSRRHPTYLAELGHGFAVAGRRTDAMGVLDELKDMSSRRYVAARSFAEVHIGLGQVDEAFAWLEQAFQQRNGWLIHVRENPRYDRLRADPRYLDLVRRMNFPDPDQKPRL